MDCTQVFILSHPDGTLEVFADQYIPVHIQRVPVAHSKESEEVAESVTELLTPRRFRPLLRPDKRIAVGSTRPLYPSVLAKSMATDKLIGILNGRGAR